MQIICGDSLVELDKLQECSVDSCVTDPPYELGFMNRRWDNTGIAFNPLIWQKVYRVLKPGAYLLAFGAPRNYHRLACAIEDAGFECRDSILWLFSSGFPKALDISKAIDKKLGAQEAKQLEGFKSCLKPSYEPIVLAMKPLDGTYADNAIKWGIGGLNIDGCRIGTEERSYNLTMTSGNFETTGGGKNRVSGQATVVGRFPSNVIFDEEAAKSLDEQNGDVSRFFYTAKASQDDRNQGLDEKSTHPTVKPIDLMQYLVRLVTPKGGTVLDPFLGSGSTGKAALLEGMDFIGIEKELEYFEIAKKRINYVDPDGFSLAQL